MDLVTSQKNSKPATGGPKRDNLDESVPGKITTDFSPPVLERTNTVASTVTDASRSVSESTHGSDDGLYSDHTVPAGNITIPYE